MARILVSFYAPKIEDETTVSIFYESVINMLKENGNDVRVLNFIFFEKPTGWDGYKNNEISDIICISKLENKIKDFNPDFILAFNNKIYDDILNIVDCPIVLWTADSLIYFAQTDLIKANIDRYYFFANSIPVYQEIQQFGISLNRLFHVEKGTAIKAEKIIQDKNISFIGAQFGVSGNLTNILNRNEHTKALNKLFISFYANPEYNFDRILERESLQYLKDIMTEQDFFSLINPRNPVLISLLDLGLSLYGLYWNNFSTLIPGMVTAFSREKVYSIKHNQDIYNSSKICLNINHPQAHNEGFSWRVLDIMASNGCLVSSLSHELAEFTKGYVDIPMYDNPFDARELCKKLLKDDNWKKDVVEGSQKCIEDKGRWEYSLKDIQNILGMKLLNKESGAGSVDYILLKDCIYSEQL